MYTVHFLCRQLTSLAAGRTRLKPKRHHKTTTNPIKNLQQRNDVRTDTEVTEVLCSKLLAGCEMTGANSALYPTQHYILLVSTLFSKLTLSPLLWVTSPS